MTVVFSRNQISIDEFERVVLNGDWQRVDTDLPECFRNIPREKIVGVYASGSHGISAEAPTFGIDIIREDPNDIEQGGRYNIDHYDGYLTSSDGAHYIALTTRISRTDHWCDEIPECYRRDAKVVFRSRE